MFLFLLAPYCFKIVETRKSTFRTSTYVRISVVDPDPERVGPASVFRICIKAYEDVDKHYFIIHNFNDLSKILIIVIVTYLTLMRR